MHLDLPGSLSSKGKRPDTGCGKGLCTKGTALQAAENLGFLSGHDFTSGRTLIENTL
jgi:hypothetical protein